MRYRAALTIPIELRRDPPQPLYQQRAGQIGTAVGGGRLATGAALPAAPRERGVRVRSLAGSGRPGWG